MASATASKPPPPPLSPAAPSVFVASASSAATWVSLALVSLALWTYVRVGGGSERPFVFTVARSASTEHLSTSREPARGPCRLDGSIRGVWETNRWPIRWRYDTNCTLAVTSLKDLTTKLSGRRLIFAGDSITRGEVWYLIQLIHGCERPLSLGMDRYAPQWEAGNATPGQWAANAAACTEMTRRVADGKAWVDASFTLGDGVHEIPVGPVHAGIIEPGHFRFSVVGERVLRLEERLGYTHKGIEGRFRGMAGAEGHRLAGRVSGDTTVAYAWAYAMAFESATGLREPERARIVHDSHLERARWMSQAGYRDLLAARPQ